ncbi:Linoleate 9S-lipoxygenase 1 [Bienertia sinuspersici]
MILNNIIGAIRFVGSFVIQLFYNNGSENLDNNYAEVMPNDGGKKKIKGTIVLMKKHHLDFPDLVAWFVDLAHELLGKGPEN